ncbi:S1 family peptidase (plasmid) [Rhizobium leguminosarum]
MCPFGVRIIKMLSGAILLISVALSAAFANSNHEVKDPAAFLEKIRGQIAYIRVYSSKDRLASQIISQGSGVVLKGGYVLTSLHLAKALSTGDGSSLFVTASLGYNEGGAEFSLSYVAEVSAHDLLLLAFRSDAIRVAAPTCVREAPLKGGDQLYSLGFPFGENISIRSGTASDVQPNRIQTSDMNFTMGDSGSPVFDANGQLTGIFRGERTTAGTGSDLYYIVPIQRAKPLLDQTDQSNADGCAKGSEVEGRVTMPVFAMDNSQPSFSINLVVRNRSAVPIIVGTSLRCRGSDSSNTTLEPIGIGFRASSPMKVAPADIGALTFLYQDSSPYVFKSRQEVQNFWSTRAGEIEKFACIFTFETNDKTELGTTATEPFLSQLLPDP